MTQVFHQPVFLSEVIEWMNLKDDCVYCDCTTGGAGHLLVMLEKTNTARFIGIDWDPEAINYSLEKTRSYRDRCFLFEDNFTNLDLIIDRLNIACLDGILFDLGASYHQLTTPKRGFSFERLGKLSMCMSPANLPLLERLHRAKMEEIIQVLKEYGNVKNYRKVGKRIYEKRNILKTTLELRNLIEDTTPRKFLKKNLHKVFQALRIWTNDELNNLKKGLSAAVRRLSCKGRIIVISYHSGEDRIAKNIFRDFEKAGTLRLLNKKVIRPNNEEVKNNPRARSAKLRIGEKCADF